MDLQIFESDGWEVRAIEKDGEAWFVASDVCKALCHTNTSMAMNMVEDDERSKLSLGRQGEVNIINESGLYSLIFRSKVESAVRFRKWVTREVLPAIRKTGKYDSAPSLPQDYATALRALANEVEQKELAIKQRDEAVRTKAEIGCRREATAMATASAATRKANKLENELGIGREWKSAKAIGWTLDFFANSRGMWMVLGKKLASLSVEMGYEVRKIEDERYGKVNSYHVDVIEKLRKRIVADDNMMGKYRK